MMAGFKATMTYEQCLSDRNSTLLSIFGGPGRIPNPLPHAGEMLNVSSGNGNFMSLAMPELPVCDLQKELDNVS